jgi:hypothetical protein
MHLFLPLEFFNAIWSAVSCWMFGNFHVPFRVDFRVASIIGGLELGWETLLGNFKLRLEILGLAWNWMLANDLRNHTKLFNLRRRFVVIWSPLQAVNLQFIYNINSSIIQHKINCRFAAWRGDHITSKRRLEFNNFV